MTDASDMDPTPDQFWVQLSWGINMHRASKDASPTFTESMIDGYEIHIVTANGSVVGNTGVSVPSRRWVSTCCDDSAYQISLKGSWPAEGHSFMIVPYQMMAGGKMFKLPIGTQTNAFVDIKEGTSRIVTGSLQMKKMTKDDANVFATNPLSVGIMQSAIVQSDLTSKLKKINVLIKNIVAKPDSTRRLLENAARRLDGWQVQTDYEILLPDTYTETFAITSLNATMLSEVVQKESKAAGMDIKVGNVTVLTPTEDTIGESIIAAGASPMAGSILVALLVALAGRQLLA